MTRPRLFAVCGPAEGTEFPVTEPETYIGRGKNNHIRINDPLLALRHCGICSQYGRCLIFAQESERGTFVNEFCFGGKFLVHGDRIKVGISILVFLDRDEVDPALLKLTEAEKKWYWAASSPRALVYEASKETVLDAFFENVAPINEIRSADEIKERACEWIFRVVPAEYVAILLAGHDQDQFVSITYRCRGPQKCDPFPIDENITKKVLREEAPVYQEKLVCCPLTVVNGKVGVIYAVIEQSLFESFGAGSIKLLETIASITAVALDHLRYVDWLEDENQSLQDENQRLKELINTAHGMIGRSERMRQAYDFVNRAGPSDRTILITGETGTGKELLARALHRNSPRCDKAFLAVNCAAVPESLLENELFGHEKEAFTGAAGQRKGLFESADGGTVFLDEVGEMVPAMQSKLLRVLEEGELRRLGGSTDVKVNVRVIAATNRNLKEEVEAGRFRPDLYFRLNVLSIEMPRLAERREDIPLLAAHFIKKHREARTGAYPPVLGISPAAHQLLMAYNWRGNVRELENAIERGIAMGVAPYILPEDLPPELRPQNSSLDERDLYDREHALLDKSLFERVLRESDWNYGGAARRLGFSLKHFYLRCKEVGVRKEKKLPSSDEEGRADA
jgi:transcriptional regulator with GAF, ATPase, and Fis domain